MLHGGGWGRSWENGKSVVVKKCSTSSQCRWWSEAALEGLEIKCKESKKSKVGPLLHLPNSEWRRCYGEWVKGRWCTVQTHKHAITCRPVQIEAPMRRTRVLLFYVCTAFLLWADVHSRVLVSVDIIEEHFYHFLCIWWHFSSFNLPAERWWNLSSWSKFGRNSRQKFSSALFDITFPFEVFALQWPALFQSWSDHSAGEMLQVWEVLLGNSSTSGESFQYFQDASWFGQSAEQTRAVVVISYRCLD